MKQKLKILIILVLFSLPYSGKAQDGQTLFTTKCVACHTIGNGRLVGPDLKGVYKKYPLKYFYKWIKSSQAVIATDAKAKALFEEYNSIVMPDFPDLKDNDIKGIVDYIKTQSGDATSATTASATTTTEDKKNANPEILASSTTPQNAETAPTEAKQDLNTVTTNNNSASIAPVVKAAAVSLPEEKSTESPATLILTSLTLLLLVVVMFMALRIFIVIRSMDKEKSAN